MTTHLEGRHMTRLLALALITVAAFVTTTNFVGSLIPIVFP